MEFEGKTYLISYTYVMIDDKEYWLFSNDEIKVTFEGTFRMKLTNLVDEGGRSECDWAFKLSPGQKALKMLSVVEPFDKANVSFTYTFLVK